MSTKQKANRLHDIRPKKVVNEDDILVLTQVLLVVLFPENEPICNEAKEGEGRQHRDGCQDGDSNHAISKILGQRCHKELSRVVQSRRNCCAGVEFGDGGGHDPGHDHRSAIRVGVDQQKLRSHRRTNGHRWMFTLGVEGEEIHAWMCTAFALSISVEIDSNLAHYMHFSSNGLGDPLGPMGAKANISTFRSVCNLRELWAILCGFTRSKVSVKRQKYGGGTEIPEPYGKVKSANSRLACCAPCSSLKSGGTGVSELNY